MPIPYIMIRVRDAFGLPVRNAKVSVTLNDKDEFTLHESNDAQGVYEQQVFGPKLTVKVSAGDCFRLTQDLTLTQSLTPPAVTSAFSGGQQESSHYLSSYSRGESTNFNVELQVVMSHLRNFPSTITRNLLPNSIPHFGAPILLSGAAGFNVTEASLSGQGQVFLAERSQAPKMIAIFVPQSLVDKIKALKSENTLQLPFHVMFHPSIPPEYPEDYPFGQKYLDLMDRYLLSNNAPHPAYPFNDRFGFFSKFLALQSNAGSKPCVMVLPIGGRDEQMGTLNTMSAMHLLLHEIRYFLLRQLNVKRPLLDANVGAAAVSGFSAGIRFAGALFANPNDTFFYNKVLKEVYSFDGSFVGPGGDTELSNFCDAVKRWFRGGAEDRALRVYTTNGAWGTHLSSVIGGTPTQGANGSSEAHGPNGSMVIMPTAFWRAFFNTLDADFETKLTNEANLIAAERRKQNKPANPENIKGEIVWSHAHQFIPAKFLEHAKYLQKFEP